MSLTEEIKSKALELGFDIVGITDAKPISSEHVHKFQNWLESGCAGQMSYMHKNFDKRTNPSQLLENAQSVIIVGLNYNPPKSVGCDTSHQINPNPTGKIVSYACYEDYHTFIKNRLRELVDYIIKLNEQDKNWIPASAGMTESGIQNNNRVTSDERPAASKICVDSVPLAERALAVRAGLGFIGKNHLMINPKLGCKVFLGEIVTDIKLQYDESIYSNLSGVRCIAPEETLCLHCDKCIKVCPTGALRSDGMFDASKCINYLTIEYRGEIPSELADKIGDRLFGCEKCIDICPYHKKALACKNRQFKFYPERMEIELEEILNMDEKLFHEKFHNTAIQRTGMEVLKRNARICLANIKSAGK